MEQLLFVIIHNNEPSRLLYLHDALKKVASILISKGIEIKMLEIGAKQIPEFSNYKFLNRNVQNSWHGLKHQKIPLTTKILRHTKFLYLTGVEFVSSKRNRDSITKLRARINKSKIEDEVSRKHIEALRLINSTYSSINYMVVFESDSVITEESIFCEEISRMVRSRDNNTLYMFNSHHSLDELSAGNVRRVAVKRIELIGSEINSTKSFSLGGLATNTLCCYGTSRLLANKLLFEIDSKESEPLPPADWMFDHHLRTIQNKYPEILFETRFYFPPLIKNGSLVGIYTSGIQN